MYHHNHWVGFKTWLLFISDFPFLEEWYTVPLKFVVCLLQACICSMSFATFTIDFSLPHFRLQTSFILLLTTVTFKFVVNQNLPRIAYLTYMVNIKIDVYLYL